MEENNTRLTRVKELESKISDKSKQSASSSSTDNHTASQSSIETKESVKSYEQLKQDVENAKDSISFKNYYDLKVQLMLAKSNID